MQVEIISVSVSTVPTAKGSYQVAEVAYKDLKDGKVSGKKIMSFSNKNVFQVITTAKQGEKFDVSLEKDDKGFWQWKTITPMMIGTAASPTQASGNPTPKSTYETPEERKIKQDYIIRQSSLSSAIALLKTEKTIPETAQVMETAEQFVTFVYGNWKTPIGSAFSDIEDDIPA